METFGVVVFAIGGGLLLTYGAKMLARPIDRRIRRRSEFRRRAREGMVHPCTLSLYGYCRKCGRDILDERQP